jgi:dTDP-4-dehydrorhamnose 3,5-epimerase-like enzyme
MKSEMRGANILREPGMHPPTPVYRSRRRQLSTAVFQLLCKKINLIPSLSVGGMHFQRPPSAQAKLIAVVHGRILDVIVDVRKSSPTYGQYALVEFSAKRLYVPIGFAHGFVTLVDQVVVIYWVSDYYVSACDGRTNRFVTLTIFPPENPNK